MLCSAITTRVKVGDLYYNLSGSNATVTLSDPLPTDDNRYYGDCPSKYTNDVYVIPSHITYNGLDFEVVEIDAMAFSGFRGYVWGSYKADYIGATGSTASKIVLPPTIKRIGEGAFANCVNLIHLVIPASVETIRKSAFSNTPFLREIVYLSSKAPSGWYATSQTYVPDVNSYGVPEESLNNYVKVLPIASIEESSSIYSGKEPNLRILNNFQGYDLHLNSLLEKNVGCYNMIATFRLTNELISYDFNMPISYSITPAEVRVFTLNQVREYGQPNPTFKIQYEGFVNDEDTEILESHAIATTTAKQTSNVGEYPINISGAKAHNYSFRYSQGELTITKADLEVSVYNASKTYGTNNPNFTLCYYGLKNNENTPEWVEYPTISTSAGQYSDVGNYDITVSGGEALNYYISKYNSGVLTIDKAEQKLTWNQNLSFRIGAKVALNAVSSVGLPVTYELPQNNIAKLYNNEGKWYVDCFGRGSVSILATQVGNHNFNAAVPINKNLIVIDTGSEPLVSLNVETAGTLPNLIADNRKHQIKNLSLTGYLNGTDINYLREMSGCDSNGNTTPGVLETLDISGCTIVSGGRNYYSSYKTANYKVTDYMFYNCKVLVNLMLPENTASIGNYAFADCDRLSAISIPDKVSSFGNQLFRNDISLLRIPMPNSLKSIGDYAFMGCNGLTEITIPAKVSYLGDGIVKNCQNIAHINVVAGNDNFVSENGVLYTSSYDKLLIFPVNYNSTTYTVREGTTRIAPYAFVDAKKLNDIVLPESLQTVGQDAFIGCVNLSTLRVKALTPPVCDNECFEAVSKTRCELVVPNGCYSYYWVAPVWSGFNKIRESDFSSIDNISSDKIEVSVENRGIVINGLSDNTYVYIFQLDGKLIYSGQPDGETLYYTPAASGTYLVVIANKTYKVMIR